MKNKRLFPFVVLFVGLFSLLMPNKSSADWAYPFVVWDGYIYVIGDEFVEEINEEIGRVTKYSYREGTYSGNFSNVYKKGTAYYSIKGIHTDEAIAVQEGVGRYKKAIRDGVYAENKNVLGIGFLTMTAGFFVLFLLWILLAYFMRRK